VVEYLPIPKDGSLPEEGGRMAASVEVSGDSLVVHIEGADRLWAIRSRLEIPVANVVSAAPASAEARKWLHGIRVGGTHIPGVLSAGRFYSDGHLVFWDVHDADKAIGIELRDERYARLVIEVADPEAAIRRITQAAAGGHG
jgi:hypothetical protein